MSYNNKKIKDKIGNDISFYVGNYLKKIQRIFIHWFFHLS